MALENEIIGVAARVQQLLSRKFNISGGSPSPQLSPEITPEYSVGGDAEDKILKQERLMSAVVEIGAVAAKRSVAQLTNLAGTNVALILESVEVFGAAGVAIIGGVAAAAAGLAQNPAAGGLVCRDTRAGRGAGSLSFDQGPPTIFAASLFDCVCNGNASPYRYALPVIIAPGFAVQVSTVAVNLAINVVMAWREVPLAPGEIGPF